MNALVEQGHFGGAAPSGNHNTLTVARQAAFLESLMQFGNVRLACRAATVSPQTAYRARRASAGFARAWDAALLAARVQAEEMLADRAINGVEEAVFYHGEEVARRRRYDSRLLLAHLARLDKLEEREDVTATLPLLDAQIEALRGGQSLPEAAPRPPRPPEDWLDEWDDEDEGDLDDALADEEEDYDDLDDLDDFDEDDLDDDDLDDDDLAFDDCDDDHPVTATRWGDGSSHGGVPCVPSRA